MGADDDGDNEDEKEGDKEGENPKEDSQARKNNGLLKNRNPNRKGSSVMRESFLQSGDEFKERGGGRRTTKRRSTIEPRNSR